ncbi:hypothetical protein [Sorangium sp. So ce1151]|uniref:hypothetical protein n=1 Tax=Sorangium sp. So ce1151 TaxID=3133332 RepID=UPI003F5E42B9
MAGTVTCLGQRVGAASALDLAFGSYLFAALLGFYHGARICEVEGLPVADFGAMAASIAPAIGQMVKHDSDTIRTTVALLAAALDTRVGFACARRAVSPHAASFKSFVMSNSPCTSRRMTCPRSPPGRHLQPGWRPAARSAAV